MGRNLEFIVFSLARILKVELGILKIVCFLTNLDLAIYMIPHRDSREGITTPVNNDKTTSTVFRMPL